MRRTAVAFSALIRSCQNALAVPKTLYPTRMETVSDLSILDRIKVSTHVGYNVFGTASAFWLDRINALNATAARPMQ